MPSPKKRSTKQLPRFHKAIQVCLDLSGKTRRDLADLLGVSPRTVGKYMAGENALRKENLDKIVGFFQANGVPKENCDEIASAWAESRQQIGGIEGHETDNARTTGITPETRGQVEGDELGQNESMVQESGLVEEEPATSLAATEHDRPEGDQAATTSSDDPPPTTANGSVATASDDSQPSLPPAGAADDPVGQPDTTEPVPQAVQEPGTLEKDKSNGGGQPDPAPVAAAVPTPAPPPVPVANPAPTPARTPTQAPQPIPLPQSRSPRVRRRWPVMAVAVTVLVLMAVLAFSLRLPIPTNRHPVLVATFTRAATATSIPTATHVPTATPTQVQIGIGKRAPAATPTQIPTATATPAPSPSGTLTLTQTGPGQCDWDVTIKAWGFASDFPLDFSSSTKGRDCKTGAPAQDSGGPDAYLCQPSANGACQVTISYSDVSPIVLGSHVYDIYNVINGAPWQEVRITAYNG